MILRRVAGGPELLAHEVEWLSPRLGLPGLWWPRGRGDQGHGWPGPGTPAHRDHCSGRSRQCPRWCCRRHRWTCWRDIRTCSCSSVSPCPTGERKPATWYHNNIASFIWKYLIFVSPFHMMGTCECPCGCVCDAADCRDVWTACHTRHRSSDLLLRSCSGLCSHNLNRPE